MSRPKLLDLFCGGGGAAMGYHRAGFDVVGVDIRPMRRYPFEFIQADALAFSLEGFAAVHASPPCQDHSVTQNFTTRRHGSGWMLAATRERLAASGLPWVIENVPGAPMRPDFKLCGCMFGLPRLKRERWFETSWHGFSLRSPCLHLEPVITVAGHGVPSHQRKSGRSITLDERKAAMGIDWMGRDELGQAIPPAYTEFIGAQLLEHLSAAEGAAMSGGLLAAMAERDAEREARGERLQGWRLALECGHSFRSADKASDGLTCCAASSCTGRKRIAVADYLGMACKTCGKDIPVGDAHGPHYDLCLACRGARIPARCPYKAGDRVQVHGYPGNPRMGTAPSAGWRGTVEGFVGATILAGIADGGRTWAEHWGALNREGTLPHDRLMWCTCCPRPAVQGALFGAEAFTGAAR